MERFVRAAGVIFLTHALSSYTILPIDKLSEKGIGISHQPGYHASPVEWKCTSPPHYSIDYSTDGSFPTYRKRPLPSSLSLDTVTALTLLLSRNGIPTDTFYCGTFIVSFKSTLPISSIIIPRSDLFDPSNGIYVGGLTAEGTPFGNCWRDIEKRAFYEYFDKGALAVAQGCGLKIFGGMTRQNREKSLRVIARTKYGKGRFKYKFFPTKELDDFNSIILRISGNDLNGTRFLDMMNSSIAADMGIDYMAYQPSVLFVNGEYWGIHNLREKVNEDYLEKNHGSDVSSTDLLIGNSSAQHGSADYYESLLEYLEKINDSTGNAMDSVRSRMDIDNFLKYSVLQTHIVNVDSRGNIRYWRSENLDNKFRWIFYDSDLSFYSFNLDFLQKKLSPVETDWYNPPWSTLILRKLLSVKSIRDRFITEYCFQLSTVLAPDSLQARILRFKHWLEPEIERHTKRRGFNQTKRNWESHVNRLLLFAQKRYETAYLHLQSNFALEGSYRLQISGSPQSPLHSIRLNDKMIRSFPFQGKFFSGIEMTIEPIIHDPDWVFERWSDGTRETVKTISEKPGADLSIHPQFQKRPASTEMNHYKIQAVSTGSWSGLHMIYIQKQIDDPGSSVHKAIFGENQVDIDKNEADIVICNDSMVFKQSFPSFTGVIIQHPVWKDGQMLPDRKWLLIDKSGHVIDRFSVPAVTSTLPFFVREGDSVRGMVQVPVLGLRPQETADNRYRFLGGVVIICIGLLVFSWWLIWRKRKSVRLSLDA